MTLGGKTDSALAEGRTDDFHLSGSCPVECSIVDLFRGIPLGDSVGL
jgi:hypothetical protein